MSFVARGCGSGVLAVGNVPVHKCIIAGPNCAQDSKLNGKKLCYDLEDLNSWPDSRSEYKTGFIVLVRSIN